MVQGHILLLRIRMTVLTLALTGGLLYSTYYDFELGGAPLEVMAEHLPEVFTEALPYLVAAMYSFVLWGPRRLVPVYFYLRSLVILALAAGWLYLVLKELVHMESGPEMVFGCFPAYTPCKVKRASEVFGLVTALLTVAEVGLTLRVGQVDPSVAQERGEEDKGEQVQNGTGAFQQHGAPILVSDQQYLQQQQQQQQPLPQFQPHFQQQPYFQQQHFQQQQQQQQAQFQQQFIPMQAFSQPQTIQTSSQIQSPWNYSIPPPQTENALAIK